MLAAVWTTRPRLLLPSASAGALTVTGRNTSQSAGLTVQLVLPPGSDTVSPWWRTPSVLAFTDGVIVTSWVGSERSRTQ